jgi:flagellar hook-associated protein 3 FlgL
MTGRVADISLSQNAIQHLQTSLAGIAELQNQASTGNKLTKPSDSPIDIGQSLQLRSSLARTDQLSDNITDAEGWLGTTDTTLGQIVTQLRQVNTLVLQSVNGSSDQVARDAIANQIEQIRQSLIGLANSQYGNRPLFGGTASGAVAYDATGAYVGSSAAVERTIAPGVRVQVNVNGDAVFGAPGTDLFSTLDQIATAVQGNQDLTTLSATLKAQTQTVQTAQANVGATYARVDSTKNQNTTNATTMTNNLTNVENVDLAEVLMNLQAQETTYQAALAAAAKAIQPSLAAFLQ